jgi:hypothetical protein
LVRARLAASGTDGSRCLVGGQVTGGDSVGQLVGAGHRFTQFGGGGIAAGRDAGLLAEPFDGVARAVPMNTPAASAAWVSRVT